MPGSSSEGAAENLFGGEGVAAVEEHIAPALLNDFLKVGGVSAGSRISERADKRHRFVFGEFFAGGAD